MPSRIPDSVIDEGAELIRTGLTGVQAAQQLGITSRALQKRLRQRGLRIEDLRPSYSSHRGIRYGPRTKRYPCRYCGSPVTREGASCRALECQRRRMRDYYARHPSVAALKKARSVARDEDERRENAALRYAAYSRGASRERLTFRLRPAEAAALRHYAEAQRLSISAAVQAGLKLLGAIQ
jgi:hypothetical protein